jgi:hypothetical protein
MPASPGGSLQHQAPLAQRQSNGLLIRRFRVQIPGGAPRELDPTLWVGREVETGFVATSDTRSFVLPPHVSRDQETETPTVFESLPGIVSPVVALTSTESLTFFPAAAVTSTTMVTFTAVAASI